MKKVLLTLVVLAFGIFFLMDMAHGHGGKYVPPIDTVGPNLGGPTAPTPGPGGGSVTPGPAGPTTNGPKGPGTGGGPITPRGSGSLTKKNRVSTEHNRWEFWWENNKDAFLNIKDKRMVGVQSGNTTFLVGRGKKSKANLTRRPPPETIKTVIIPALLGALDEKDIDILDSAPLALARIVRAEKCDSLINRLTPLLKSKHNSVQQATALSLGVLRSPKAVHILKELVQDSKKGRKIMGVTEVPRMVRSFSALSLGMINSPVCADLLMQVVSLRGEVNNQLKACAIQAMGLLKGNKKKDEVILFLTELLRDKKLKSYVKAVVPVALGKLGDRTTLPLVMHFLKTNSNKNALVQQSLVICLGQLASLSDKEAIKLLKDYISKGKDEQARNFAYISLAQIGARTKDNEENHEALKKLHQFFSKAVSHQKRKPQLPWAVLSAAIFGRAHERFQTDLIQRISDKFENTSGPSERGAMAIALGLLNGEKESPMLFKALKNSKDNSLRGYICVALGFMKHTDSKEFIQRMLEKKSSHFRIKLQTATALGLMGDPEVVSILVREIEKTETLSSLTSLVKALGLIGDEEAVAPLCKLLRKRKASPLARAFAVVALGLLAEKTDLPWNCALTRDNNYRANTPAMNEVTDIM